MAKSTRSVLNSYKKDMHNMRNKARKQMGLSTQKKPAYYNKHSSSSYKPYKPKKAKPINPNSFSHLVNSEENNQQAQNGCYVATCVYGSYDCPEVWTLRRFRDNTLDSTRAGRLFIRCYYRISPTIVRWFGQTAWFRQFWRILLDKMVDKLNRDGVEDTQYFDK